MTITAKIIADSITSEGVRVTTMQLRYTRFFHQEFLTHRNFSRNSSSSRAIPVRKMIEEIRRDPAMPIFWGKNQPGMQAKEELSPFKIKIAKAMWLSAMYTATFFADIMDRLGFHKQHSNRIAENFSHINTVVTSTDWSNFFALRRHPDAQPEIKALADAMYEAMQESSPKVLVKGEWHLPYITDKDRLAANDYVASGGMIDIRTVPENLMKTYINDPVTLVLIGVSVARCARTSYLLHDGTPSNFEKDFALYQRLVGMVPLHSSPCEHQATGDTKKKNGQWLHPEYHGNFKGVIQYRKLLPGECQ